jgi:hypothetical protein
MMVSSNKIIRCIGVLAAVLSLTVALSLATGISQAGESGMSYL